MDDKVPDVDVIVLLILQKFACTINDSNNARKGLILPISAVKVSSSRLSFSLNFSKILMILKRTSMLQKSVCEAVLSNNSALLQLLYLQ